MLRWIKGLGGLDGMTLFLDLDLVVIRALAKEPADRYQSPAEVATVLAPLATLEPPVKEARGFWRKKKPTRRAPLPGKKKPRRWQLLAGVAALGLLLAAALAFVPLSRSGSTDVDGSATAPHAGPLRHGQVVERLAV